MELGKAQEVLKWIGEKVAFAFGKIISFVAKLGLNLSELQVKITSLIILLIMFYIILKFVTIGRKIIKYGILFLILLLIFSIIFSF